MSSIRTRAPVASSIIVRHVMQAIGSSDTEPEKTLRSSLHRLGLRFRKDSRPVDFVRCKADIVFSSAKVCIFVDGCFWHGCPIHFRPPKSNTDWWTEKIDDNRRRDKRQTEELERHGWFVIRFWEHGIINDLESCVERVSREVFARKT